LRRGVTGEERERRARRKPRKRINRKGHESTPKTTVHIGGEDHVRNVGVAREKGKATERMPGGGGSTDGLPK